MGEGATSVSSGPSSSSRPSESGVGSSGAEGMAAATERYRGRLYVAAFWTCCCGDFAFAGWGGYCFVSVEEMEGGLGKVEIKVGGIGARLAGGDRLRADYAAGDALV